MGRGFLIQKDQPKITTSLRGAKRRTPGWPLLALWANSPSGNLLERTTAWNPVPGDCTTGIPFGHHGLRPRNDMLVGTWCGFAGLRRGFRCDLRSGTQAVPYGGWTEDPVGTPLPGCPDRVDPSRRGDPCGRPGPHHEGWVGRPQADRPTVNAVPRSYGHEKSERESRRDTPPGVSGPRRFSA